MELSEYSGLMMSQARALSKIFFLILHELFFLITSLCWSMRLWGFCRILRINLPAGAHPTAIAFSQGASSVVVAAQALLGSSLYMYADVGAPPAGGNKQQGKLSPPEIKWEHRKIHGKESVLNLAAARATYGTGDGSTILISCSEGICH